MSKTDVALCLYDADGREEDGVDKALLIDVVQDVDHELEDYHDALLCNDVLLYLFPPLSFKVMMWERLMVIKSMSLQMRLIWKRCHC